MGKTDYFDWAIFNSYFDITRGQLGFMYVHPPRNGILVGGLEHFSFSHILRIIIPMD